MGGSDRCEDYMVTCLSSVKVAGVTSCLRRLVESAGEEVVVVVHVSTNDVENVARRGLEAKFRLLVRKLIARTQKVAFLKVPAVHMQGQLGKQNSGSLNVWMTQWCWEEDSLGTGGHSGTRQACTRRTGFT